MTMNNDISEQNTTIPLFLDVDGVLNVFPYMDHKGEWGDFVSEPVTHGSSTFVLTVSRTCCDALQALSLDIHWLTTWGQDANRLLAGLTGFPPLPVLCERINNNPWWKLNCVHEWASSQEAPIHFVWIDDDAIPMATSEVFPDALLIRTNPRVGVTPHHISQIKAYLESI